MVPWHTAKVDAVQPRHTREDLRAEWLELWQRRTIHAWVAPRDKLIFSIEGRRRGSGFGVVQVTVPL